MSISSTLFLKKALDYLVKPFKEWSAFRMGIIDQTGNILVSKLQFRRNLDPLQRVIRRFKMLLTKYGVPDNKHSMSLISLWLLKEENILGSSLNTEKSKKCSKEIAEIIESFDFEEELEMQRVVNHTKYVAKQCLKAAIDEYIEEEPEIESFKYKSCIENKERKRSSAESAAIIYLCKYTDRMLFLKRSSNEDYAKGKWEITVGGKQESFDINVLDTINRESEEELGLIPEAIDKIYLMKITNTKKLMYVYIGIVANEFVPTLSDEHTKI